MTNKQSSPLKGLFSCFWLIQLICLLVFLNAPQLPEVFAFSLPNVLPGETQVISIFGSTVKIKGITDQYNTLVINNRDVTIQKDGSFHQDVIIPPGETEVVITVIDKDGKTKTYKKKIVAKEKYFFLVGIADGTLNLVDASKNFDLQRDNATFDDGFQVDGKVSYYLVGKIKGKYLIKSALDTDKATQEKLFTNIDPQKYYPIYGDDSTVVYDVNSQGKFYLLVEWDKSGLTVGNYQTQLDDTQLAKYNRTLYGGKIHLETKGNTIYGDPKGKLTGFFAEANQYAGHSEFLGTGGSLYYLRHRNIIEGSEKVRIDIRDKNTGMTIYSIPQEENKDYEIKYDQGRILFYKPILSVASSDTLISNSILEGNPVYVVVNYEYKSQEAFPFITEEDLDKWSGGARVSQHIGNHIRVGGTYAQERKDAKDHRLYGEDATIKIGNFTKLEAEFAQSRADSIPAYVSYNGGLDFTTVSLDNRIRNRAHRFSLNSSLGEFFGKEREFLDVSGFYQFVGNNFSSADSLFQAGTEKYGMEVAHKLTENDKLRFITQTERLNDDVANRSSENNVTAKETNLYSGQWVHTKNKWTFTSEYQHKELEGSLSYYQRPNAEDTVAERIGYQFNKDTSIFVGQQATLKGQSNHQTQAGLATKLFKDTGVTAQTAFGSRGNSVLAGLTRQIDENTQTYMNYSIANSKLDGKSSTTSFGANTKINKDAELRTERQFITTDTRGIYSSNLTGLDYQITPRLNLGATYQRREDEVDYNLMGNYPQESISANTSYIKPDRLKTNSKFEYREDTDNAHHILTDNSAELKVTQDIFLFGEYDYSVTRKNTNTSYARIDVKHLGLAYRPVKYDWFNCLFKYIRLTDYRPEGLTSPDGGFTKIRSISDVWAGETALDLPWNFQLVEKVSYKDEKTVNYDVLGIVKTPEDLKALLWINRLNFHLTSTWDIAGEYRMLKQKGSDKDSIERGFLLELARRVFDNVYVGAGFNSTSFTDDLTAKYHNSAYGFFLRLQGRY